MAVLAETMAEIIRADSLVPLAVATRAWDKMRWPNFSPAEMACRCCGEVCWAPADFDRAQRLRDLLGRPVRFNSTHRCRHHNARVGGAPLSEHKRIAFDFSLRSPAATRREIEDLQERMFDAGFRTFGLYRTFIHIDARPGRFWVTPGGREWTPFFRRTP